MKNLFVIKKIIEDKSISDEAFVVWCGLRSIMQKEVKVYFVSTMRICAAVFERKPTRSEREMIEEGYAELIERGYIRIIVQFSKNEYKADLSKLYFETGSEYFSDISEEEMQKIMTLQVGKIDKCKMLRYFACMVSTFNRSTKGIHRTYCGKIGGMSLDSFTEKLNASKKTLILYNKVLSENKILYVITHEDFYVCENGSIRQRPNTYARWCDRELAKEFDEEFNGYKALTDDNKIEAANKKRSLARKLHCLQAGKEYGLEDMKEMYKYASQKNFEAERKCNEEIKKGVPTEEPELIDMSIFDSMIWMMCGIDDVEMENTNK